MRSIKLRLLLFFAGLSLLGACSTFDRPAQNANASNDEAVQQEGPTAESDPVAAKALQLRGEPNLYQLNKALIPAQAKEQFKQALALKRQGKLSEAQGLFLRLSELYPTLSGPWLQLADLSLLQAKNTKQASAQGVALKLLEKALLLNPENYFAHNRLAALLRQQGQFKQAEVHYQKAIASWPGFAEVYLNRGILYDLYLGDKQQALEHYQLYQALIDAPERRVKGWIADLARQINAAQQEVVKQ
jgi:tetratricopeptide (TPR) repeat protein